MPISDAQAETVMTEALTARGLMPAAAAPVVNAAAPAATPAPADAPKPAAEQVEDASAPMRGATPTDQAAIAGAFNNAPASPGHYDFKPAPGVAVDQAQDASMRALFHSEGISLGTGNQIAKLWNAAAATPPGESQLATQQASAMAELSRSGNAGDTIALARSEVDRLEARSPGVKAMLEASGLGNNVWLVRTLAARAMARKP